MRPCCRTPARYLVLGAAGRAYPPVVQPNDGTTPLLLRHVAWLYRAQACQCEKARKRTEPAVADGFRWSVPPAGLEPCGCCCCCMCGWCRLVRMPRHLGIEPLLIIYCFGASGVGEWLSPPVFAWGIRVWRCISGCLVAGGLGTVDLVVRRGSWRRMRGVPIGGGGLAR